MGETEREPDADLARQVGGKLAHEFAGVFSPETIEQFAFESYAVYSSLGRNAHTAGYLPILIERFVRKRLEFAREEQITVDDVPEVLFVCVHNAGRSQMAVALLEHHAHGRMQARAGGSAPTDRINPSVVAAMDEIGLDVSKEVPKPVTDDMVKAANVVITMGCGDVCPIFPGKHYGDWVLEDPAGRGLEAIRPIRDEIDRRVRALLADLA